MWLRAGWVSFVLLLASRVSGLLRESAQAASFGSTGLGDIAVLLFTLPDWVAGVVASGALSYVLVPLWAGQSVAAQRASLQRVMAVLVALGLLAVLALALWPGAWVAALAPGLASEWAVQLKWAMLVAGFGVPLAFVASILAARLQHHQDFAGMYGANLAVNFGLIATLAVTSIFIANNGPDIGQTGNFGLFLAFGVVFSGLLRLLWQWWRLRRLGAQAGGSPEPAPGDDAATRPSATTWLWAFLAAGAPVALPLLARSWASGAGEGALASFSYAWKLVELPSVLVIQLVASLALPMLARAHAMGTAAGAAQAKEGEAQAHALAWALACSCAAGLQWGAAGAAQLLFGWGRMGTSDVALLAQWASVGAFCLLPQAILSVAGAALAVRGRLMPLAVGYGVALLAMYLWATFARPSPWALMWGLVAGFSAVAGLVLWFGMPADNEASGSKLKKITYLGIPLALLVGMATLAPPASFWLAVGEPAGVFGRWAAGFASLASGVAAAALVFAVAFATNPRLKAALRKPKKG